MKKIFTYDKMKLNIYDISTSIIFNDEKIKKRMLNVMPLDDYTYIDSKVIMYNITVKKFLEINEFNMKLVPFYNLQSLMSKKISSLDLETQIFIKIIINLNDCRGIVIFDDVLSYLSDFEKEKVVEYIHTKNIKFINITSNMEETVDAPYLIVLANDVVAIEGSTINVLKEEKLLKRLGFNLPFIVDLSLNLKSYGVIDDDIFDLDRMVDKLWN